MKTITKNLLRLALVAAFLTTLGVGFAQAQFLGRGIPSCTSDSILFANQLSVVGLRDNGELICFRVNEPGSARRIGMVTGMNPADTALIGMDYRVQDGRLYGVGNGGGVYTINAGTGAATFVNQLTVALDGTTFGVDFNPAADRLRIISNTGQNLRHNVNPGGVTISDGTLNYAMVTATDVTGAAYTNNDFDPATPTTLYDIDTNLDLLAIQNPPNTGTLNVVGSIGFPISTVNGFDIYSYVRGGTTAGNEGYAALGTIVGSRFFFIDLDSGTAFDLGGFGFQVTAIAIPLGQL